MKNQKQIFNYATIFLVVGLLALIILTKNWRGDRNTNITDEKELSLSPKDSMSKKRKSTTKVNMVRSAKNRTIQIEPALSFADILEIRDFDRLIEIARKNRNLNSRLAAIHNLKKCFPSKSRNFLLSLLMDTNVSDEEKIALVQMFKCDRNKDYFDQLLNILNSDASSELKTEALYSLGWSMNKLAIEPILNLIDSNEDTSIKLAAIKALGTLRMKSSVEALIGLLNNRDPAIRLAAIRGIWWNESGLNKQFTDKRSIESLAILLRDESPKVREQAVLALAKIGDKAHSLLEEMLKSKNANVRACAAAAMMSSQNQMAVAPLINALNDPNVNIRKNLRRV